MRTFSKNRSYANVNRIHTINRVDAKIDNPHSPERELYNYIREANEIRPKPVYKILGIEKEKTRAEVIREKRLNRGRLISPLRLTLQ